MNTEACTRNRKVSRLEQVHTFVLHIISLASELPLPVVCQRVEEWYIRELHYPPGYQWWSELLLGSTAYSSGINT